MLYNGCRQISQLHLPPQMVQFKNLRSNLRMSTVAHLSSLYELMAIVTSIRWRPMSALSYNYERHTNEGWPETSQWKLFPCHNAILVLVHMPSKLKGDSTAIATDTNHEHNHESDQPELTWAACLWRDQEARDGVAKIWIQIYCVHIPGFFCPGT